ncbi:hypothetical protein SPSYN_00801 [Sporotomaculum syntrophicum]|uniref:Uncharacterized protein n=1 Tax=Sporotomaculum syntrophicum TaxID=182264 RepID=A0A9D2WRK3_9FIRM|nr:DUF5693 family protein [Sporotomaculum syntrophicum]KAF1086063.1 hypothetical protein SPSYN_00801 [Sporotomaculum syntrophicum]
MNESKWKALLIGIILVALLSAGYTAWQRHGLEENNQSVAITVVYDEAAALARMNGQSVARVLSKFKENGVSTVLVKEPTVRDAEANGELLLCTGGELLLPGNASLWQQFGEEFRAQIKPDCRYLLLGDSAVFQRVLGQLQAKQVAVRSWAGGEGTNIYIIEVAYHWGLFEQMGLGFPSGALEEINAAGLDTMVQVRSWNQVTPAGLTYVLRELKKIPNLSGILFNDPVLPGYPKNIRLLSYLILELDVPLVQIEFTTQKGLANLGLLLDKNVVRLHTLSLEEDNKKNYDIAEMVDRFNLAAAERNIRVLLLHSYMKSDEPDMLAFNLQLAQATRDNLEAEGLQVGEASELQPMHNSRLVLFVTGLGVIAGAMLLVIMLGWNRAAMGIGLLGLLAWTGMLAVELVTPARKIMAFIAVVVFPTLSLMVNVRQGGTSVGQSILMLLRTSVYSLVGALLMVGLLGDIGFMLKLDQFSGVKLAHVVPLLLLVVIFFFKVAKDGGGWQRKLQELLEEPVLVKFVLIGGLLLVALMVYVSRTGNESAAISNWELQFRALLDNLLGVRPRTKEFLLGHPLLLLMLYLGYRNNKYLPLLLGGAIGQISLVNTYAHIHTPLVISLLRSLHGLWLGILIGLILIALWRFGEALLVNHRGRLRRD